MATKPLTERDRDVLAALYSACYPRGSGHRWVRPMDLGGQDASHHSATLAKLTRRGFVARKPYGSFRSFLYRITPAGSIEAGMCG